MKPESSATKWEIFCILSVIRLFTANLRKKMWISSMRGESLVFAMCITLMQCTILSCNIDLLIYTNDIVFICLFRLSN